MRTTLNVGWRVVAAFLCAVFAGPWLVFAADVTPGYTFSSGEQNVTHTKLNNASAGTVNTTFYSSRAAAAADPSASSYYLLLLDSGNNVFKKATLAAGIFDHTALLHGRTAKTAPVAGDYLLLADSEAGNAYKKVSVTSLLAGGAAMTSVTNDDRIPVLRARDTNQGTITWSNVFAGAFPNTNAAGGDLSLNLSATRTLVSTFRSNEIAALPMVTNQLGSDEFRVLRAGELKRIAVSNALSAFATPYILIQEWTNANSVPSGVAATPTKRSLNVLKADTGGYCVLSNNAEFYLLPGTYRFAASAPAYANGGHQAELFNVSTNGVVAYGTTEYSGDSGGAFPSQSRSFVTGRFQVTSNTLLQLRHTATLAVGAARFGLAFAHATSNMYSQAEFWREPGP